MSDKATGKRFRDELGDGYLNLLDSVRHSFEQAAWGQETSGDLAADNFYRWAGAEPSPQPAQAGLGEGVEARPAEARPVEGEVLPPERQTSDPEWAALEAWVDGKMGGRAIAPPEHERDVPGRDGPEIGD